MAEGIKRYKTILGISALLIALALMAECTRSYFVHDSFGYPVREFKTVGVMSAWGSLIWCSQYHKNVEPVWTITEWTIKSDPFSCDGITYVYRLGGFAGAWIYACQRTNGVETAIWKIPYGAFVVPLCFLSYSWLEPTTKRFSWCRIGKYVLVLYLVIELL